MYDKIGKHWDSFIEYARDNGIEFRHPEDYEPFWKCWMTAIDTVLAEHHCERVSVCKEDEVI